MTATPPDWHPDPVRDERPSPRGAISTRVWIVIAAVAVFAVLAVSAIALPRLFSRSAGPSHEGSRAPAHSSAETLHSKVIPELVLPPGTTPFGGPSVDRVEYWRVPLPFDEVVDQLRAQLPVGRPYGRLQWCGESVSHQPPSGSVDWRWGAEPDYLAVLVQHGSAPDSTGLSIGFDGDPLACRR